MLTPPLLLSGVPGDTVAPVLPMDKQEEPDQTAGPEAATEVLPRLSDYSWFATTWLQEQDPIFGPVLAAWPAKPSGVKEPSTHHTGIGAAVPSTVPWKMGSSIVGRLTSVVVNKWVSWCFTPCHPVRLHQGDSVVVFPSSWFCPAHFGLMSWRSFMIALYGPPRLWAHHGVSEAFCLLARHA